MGFGNWWDQTVVPRIVKFGCATEDIMALRRDVVPQAEGKIFELGCGGGINQQLYDRARVTSFTGLDPSGKLLDYARQAAAKKGWQADIRQGFGEAIPFDDESFDTLVCTFTLCSVNDQAQTLSELRRVLRPGGTFLYAEHGRSPEAKMARRQERIDPLWKRVFGNCHLSRPVTSAIERAGFTAAPVGQRYMRDKPSMVGWLEWGVAVKAG
ncbi:MAG: class I SAM-dependent methyltransferase [Sphingomonadales bacterium]|nr:class I SAM-dependent methyltransferase [Sphingomonadales bacterium]